MKNCIEWRIQKCSYNSIQGNKGHLERLRKRLHIGKPGGRRVPLETDQILFETLFLE